MSIVEIWEKIKSTLRSFKMSDGIVISIIVVVALLSFSLGRASNQENDPVLITNATPFPISGSSTESTTLPMNEGGANGTFVASVNGTKYYPSDCSGSKRINEENKIYFNNADDAEKAGYELSTLCK